MAKSSGLAVLALLIAIGALGFGIFQFFFAAPKVEKTGIQHTWYDFHYAEVLTNPISTVITVNQLTIDFTVGSGESVYFHFNTWADVDAGANSYIQINFVLDGSPLSGPTYPWWVVRTTEDNMEIPVSCQLSIDSLTVGNHTASINIFGSDNNNRIFSSTLLVQTYVP
ncbi:MAG: hypothetical protein ACFFDH_01430 [Promethearchaeota archaeon]